MNLWDKALHAALAVGRDIDEAIGWAEKTVKAFEARFHPEKKDDVDQQPS